MTETPTKPAQARILEAAINAFAASGYSGTSLRAIASKANCDVALIPYYFGSKAELFMECIGDVARSASSIPSVAEVGVEAAPRAITQAIIDRFYSNSSANIVTLIVRSAAASENLPYEVRMQVNKIFQEFLDDAVGTSTNREDRLPNYLFGASMLGTLILAEMVDVPVLKDLTDEETVDLLAPELEAVVQRDLEHGHISVPE